jgi:hypothetical protein
VAKWARLAGWLLAKAGAAAAGAAGGWLPPDGRLRRLLLLLPAGCLAAAIATGRRARTYSTAVRTAVQLLLRPTATTGHYNCSYSCLPAAGDMQRS